MNEKKTAVMTVRIPPSTKSIIDSEAEKRDWTPSKLAEKILTEWAQRTGTQNNSLNFYINTNDSINIGGQNNER